MSHDDSLQNAGTLVAACRESVESAFEVGLSVAGQVRTGFARLLPPDLDASAQRTGALTDLLGRIGRTVPALGDSLRLRQPSQDAASQGSAISSMLRELGEIDAMASRSGVMLDALADSRAGLRDELKHTQKLATRPLGTLVSLVQAGDAFDQRLSHLQAAFPALPEQSPGAAARGCHVLHTQIDAIGGRLTEVRAQARLALDSVTDLLHRLGAGVDALTAVGQRTGALIAEMCDRLDHCCDQMAEDGASAQLPEMAELRDALAGLRALGVGSADGCALCAETEVRAGLDRLVELAGEWESADASLSHIAPRLAEVQECLQSWREVLGDTGTDECDLGFLSDLYTMDEERSAHAHALGTLHVVTAGGLRRTA